MHLRAALHSFSIFNFIDTNDVEVGKNGRSPGQDIDIERCTKSDSDKFLVLNSYEDILSSRIVLVNVAIDLSVDFLIMEEMKYLVHLRD